MKPYLRPLALAAALSTSLVGCHKETETVTPAVVETESLTEGQDDFVASHVDAGTFSRSGIVLPDGQLVTDFLRKLDPNFLAAWQRSAGACATYKVDPQLYKTLGPQESKKTLLAQLLYVGQYLTDRSRFAWTGQPNGLGYSYGSEDYCLEQVPPNAQSVCREKMYGLDCSGLFRVMFRSAGVTAVSSNDNALALHKPAAIEKAIKASIPAFCKVQVVDLGQLAPGDMKSGDVIYWSKLPHNEKDKNGKVIGRTKTAATHIGIILVNKAGEKASYQSNGTYKYSCKDNKNEVHGPGIVQLNDPYWFDQNYTEYSITRINVNLSGKWKYYMRCTGASTDAVSMPLEFDTKGSTTWTTPGTGVDYNGKPISIAFSFKFDNATNILTGTADMTFPGTTDRRIDNFSISLDADDTGYKDATRGAVTNSGCPVQVRLVNTDRCL